MCPNVNERVGLDTFWDRYLLKWQRGPIDITMDNRQLLGSFLALMGNIILPMLMAAPRQEAGMA
jgi:hypothetical protein